MTAPVVPTQQDREAASSAYFAWISGNPVIPVKMRSGELDDHSMVQAFARHRLAALEEAARVAWQPIETAPRDGDPFIATIEVSHINGASWWETHAIWCDDETGEIDPVCEQGWAIDNYSYWMPLPEPPAIRSLKEPNNG